MLCVKTKWPITIDERKTMFLYANMMPFMCAAIPSLSYGAVTGLCMMQRRQPAHMTMLQKPSLYQLSYSSKKQGVINELIIIVTTDIDDRSITEPKHIEIEFTTIDTTTSTKPRIHIGVK